MRGREGGRNEQRGEDWREGGGGTCVGIGIHMCTYMYMLYNTCRCMQRIECMCYTYSERVVESLRCSLTVVELVFEPFLNLSFLPSLTAHCFILSSLPSFLQGTHKHTCTCTCIHCICTMYMYMRKHPYILYIHLHGVCTVYTQKCIDTVMYNVHVRVHVHVN